MALARSCECARAICVHAACYARVRRRVKLSVAKIASDRARGGEKKSGEGEEAVTNDRALDRGSESGISSGYLEREANVLVRNGSRPFVCVIQRCRNVIEYLFTLV